MALKKNDAPPSAVAIPSDDVELTAPPKRSMRKRKQVAYTERTEEYSDIAEEVPKKRTKATAKSKVAQATTSGIGEEQPAKKGKGKKEVVVVDDESEDEEEIVIPKPKPKPKPRKRKSRDDEIEYDDDGEEIRKRDYQEEPFATFPDKLARALLQPLQFVDRQRCDMDETPRETFTISGSSGKDYTVDIRHVLKCSCMDFIIHRSSCKHILYTLVKVLKVPETSPFLYQLALTSAELQSIFNNAPAAPHIDLTAEEPDPNRKPIEGDCPICYSEFEPDEERITYCKAHCGNNVHQGCMQTWLRSQRSSYGKGTCPYCRMAWID